MNLNSYHSLLLIMFIIIIRSFCLVAQPAPVEDQSSRIIACVKDYQRSKKSLFVKVTRVVDGDTFYAQDTHGKRTKYRLIGIDTPEFAHFGRPAEPYAQEATDFLKRLIANQTIRIEYDIQIKDKYNRDLVYVYTKDDIFVNQELVRTGWAYVSTFPPNITFAQHFHKSQRQARQQGRGVWR